MIWFSASSSSKKANSSTPARNVNFHKFNVTTEFHHRVESHSGKSRSLFNHISHPKQTLISSSSAFMCRTFASSFFWNFNFMRIGRWRRTQPHLILRSFSDMLQFSMAFHYHCCVVRFPFSSQQRSGSKSARNCNTRNETFNFKYQKWALNYPQEVVDARVRHPFIFYVRSVVYLMTHRRFISCFSFSNQLSSLLFGSSPSGKSNIKCTMKCAAREGDDDGMRRRVR